MSPNGLGEFNGFIEAVSVGVIFEVESDGVYDLLHVAIFALSARYTSLFSHFVRFIFIRLRNSLKTSEQTDGHQRDESRESS